MLRQVQRESVPYAAGLFFWLWLKNSLYLDGERHGASIFLKMFEATLTVLFPRAT